MNKLTTTAAAVALATASLSASAYWGWGAPTGWGHPYPGAPQTEASDETGQAEQAWGPYYAYRMPPWAGFQAPSRSEATGPYAFAEEQRAAMAERHQALLEQSREVADRQAEALQKALEAQRAFAEQLGARHPGISEPLGAPAHPASGARALEQELMQQAAEDRRELLSSMRRDFGRPFGMAPPAVPSYEERIQEVEAQREAMLEAMEARREEARKRLDERRDEVQARRAAYVPVPGLRTAPGDI